MRTGSIAFRVAGVAAVLVMAPATAAFAGNSVKATVNPAASAPGGKVEIRVVGCRDRSGAARSAAFVADAELSARGGHGWLTGTAKVRADAEPGTYALRVTCDLRDHRHAGSVRVEGHPHEPSHSARPSQPSKPSHPTRPRPSHTPGHEEPPDRPSPSASRPHESPVAPVRAGGGGTAVLAAPVSTVDTDDAGPSTSQTVIGLALAGVAAVAVALRSARRRRRTGAD
ncbi:hypothetical protein ACH4D4_32825 [Streptomyces pristinaespiralis]|uniref:hypothetical protein n=1 Tax=Streptomyces pristinaespiralis TaxID=38300 RepID=UPI0037A1C64A